jgi:hypothetical protein
LIILGVHKKLLVVMFQVDLSMMVMLLLLKIVAMEEMLLLLFKIEYDAIFIED